MNTGHALKGDLHEFIVCINDYVVVAVVDRRLHFWTCFVVLSVCLQTNSTYEWILMKFSGNVNNDTRNRRSGSLSGILIISYYYFNYLKLLSYHAKKKFFY